MYVCFSDGAQANGFLSFLPNINKAFTYLLTPHLNVITANTGTNDGNDSGNKSYYRYHSTSDAW
jgi:hypothetical protein